MAPRLRRGSIAMLVVYWSMRLVRRVMPSRAAGDLEQLTRSMQAAGPAEVPRRVHRSCHVAVAQWQGLPVHTLTPREPGGGLSRTARRMIYLHGGGYSAPIHSAHWKMVAKVAVENDLTVVVPTFALAPEGSGQEGIERLLALYRELEDISGPVDYLAGDSSGGGFAYAFIQRIRDEGLKAPRLVFLFSPWLDVTLGNPDIDPLTRMETILDVPTLRHFGRAWAGGEDPRSSSVSPIFGDLTGLPPVHLFIGTKDIFVADCRALVAKARETHADVWFYEYFGAFHVFMWLGWLPESRDVFRKIREITRSDLDQ